MRVGVIRHFHERDAVEGFGADSAPSAAYGAAFDAACRTLESLGARLVDLQLSPLIDYVDANRLIMLAEAYALHEKDFQERPQDFGHHMFARIGLGAFLTAADYVEATRQRRELAVEFARALSGVDVAVSANATGPAPRIDAGPGLFDLRPRVLHRPLQSDRQPGLVGADRLRGRPAARLPDCRKAVRRGGRHARRPRLRAGDPDFHRQRPPIAASLPSQR